MLCVCGNACLSARRKENLPSVGVNTAAWEVAVLQGKQLLSQTLVSFMRLRRFLYYVSHI